MVTEPCSKSTKLKLIAWILVGVIFAGLHTYAISLVRKDLYRNDSIVVNVSDYADRFLDGSMRNLSHELNKIRAVIRIYSIAHSDAVKYLAQREPASFPIWVRNEVCFWCATNYPDLDPQCILALIYHESRFNPTVVNSKTGAVGLMQILPKWHTQRAERLGTTLTDPAGNIQVGCDILNEVYQQSKSMSYALNVYAGGYPYADRYKDSSSPFEIELIEILNNADFLNLIGR